MKKIIFLLITLSLAGFAFGQSALRTKMTVDQRTNYSKALSAYEHSELNTLVNTGTAITIFLPNDFAMSQLPESEANGLSNKNQSTLAQFAKTYSVLGAFSSAKLMNDIKASPGGLKVQGRNNQQFTFLENPPYILINVDDKVESNIEATILINKAVIHLVSGLLK